MKRYSKVSVELWGDDKFLALTPMRPSGQALWTYLLTSPYRSVIPGITLNIGLSTIAERLPTWTLAATKKHWEEIAALNMAKADWRVGMIWLPRAIVHNEPESPNVVSYWHQCFALVPQCALRAEAEQSIVRALQDMGLPWIEAWNMAPKDREIEYRLHRWLRNDPKLRQTIKQRDDDHCRYCDRMVNWSDRRGPNAGSYDHIDPRGGNDLENVVTACRSCNSRKGRRTPEQAGMVVLRPRSDLGRDPGSSTNQYQYQYQYQDEYNPPTPLKGGNRKRRQTISQADVDHIKQSQEVKRLIEQGMNRQDAMRKVFQP